MVRWSTVSGHPGDVRVELSAHAIERARQRAGLDEHQASRELRRAVRNSLFLGRMTESRSHPGCMLAAEADLIWIVALSPSGSWRAVTLFHRNDLSPYALAMARTAREGLVGI